MSSFSNCTALLLFPDNSLHLKLQAFKNEWFFQSFPFLVLFYYTKMQGVNLASRGVNLAITTVVSLERPRKQTYSDLSNKWPVVVYSFLPIWTCGRPYLIVVVYSFFAKYIWGRLLGRVSYYLKIRGRLLIFAIF